MKQFLGLLLLSVLLPNISCNGQEKTSIIHIELEGHRYDSLHLRLNLDDDKREVIRGYSKDGSHWEFSYPNSLYNYIRYATLVVPGNADSIRHNIGFYLILEDETMKAGNYCFGKLISQVKARYLETNISHNIPMAKPGTNYAVRGTIISDDYEISTDDQELTASIKGLYYSYSTFSRKFTYKESLQRYISITEQYPNSSSLISTLANTMGYYNSKADIAKVFNCFSEENKQSYYGQKINKYLTQVDTVFKNQLLPRWDTGVPEAIIQDSSNYNLIIFSASWCSYCHQQIPVLKEVYRDLGQELIMTYVSVDKKEDIDKWKLVMQKNEISWRSLMALDNYKVIYDEYAFFGIPHTILVHPVSMKMDILDVRKQEDKSRLYELIKTE